MIAQLVLSALLAGVLFYAWMEYLRSPLVGLLAWAAALVGLYFVWVPSHATQLAELVGIGRGVDLILDIVGGWAVVLGGWFLAAQPAARRASALRTSSGSEVVHIGGSDARKKVP